MWWELSLNPSVILAYYSQPPQLRHVEVHSVLLHREGPVLELLAEMPRFPDKPSPRWPAGANTAQARLRFFDLREVSLLGWDRTNTGDLLVEREGGAIRFRFDCPTARLAGLAEFFDITGVTGYVKGTPNS